MQNNIKEIMIFAAGLGSRMLSITENTPKPLLTINNKPIIEYVLDSIAISNQNIEKVVINTFYLKEKIISYIDQIKNNYKFEVIMSIENEKLEVGGGLKFASKYFTQDIIFTLNADSFVFGLDVLSLLQTSWDANFMDCLMFCTKTDNVIGQIACDFSLEYKNASELVSEYDATSELKLEYKCESKFELNHSHDSNIRLNNIPTMKENIKNQYKIGKLIQENKNLTYTGAQIINLNLIKNFNNTENSFSIANVLFNKNRDVASKIYGLITSNSHKYLHANTADQLKQIENYLLNNKTIV